MNVVKCVDSSSRLLFALALALASMTTLGQDDDNLYRVELIIFERAQHQSDTDSEKWPKNISLSYPENWVRLLSPEDAEQVLQQKESNVDTEFSLSNEFLRSIGNATQEADQETLTPEPIDQNLESQEPQSENLDYFRFLPSEQKSLIGAKRQLDRMGYLRTLLHETWIQPITDEKSAPGLIVRAGNPFEQHHELEGYITLTVGRYLHIQTNLWFTEFVPNYGQMSEHWPPLPKFPAEYLDSKSLQSSFISAISDDSDTSSNYDLTRFSGDSTEFSPYANSLSDQVESENFQAQDLLSEDEYLINETVVLQQKRRMRSKELHYIDHPRLGLLIKITPFETDTIDQ